MVHKWYADELEKVAVVAEDREGGIDTPEPYNLRFDCSLRNLIFLLQNFHSDTACYKGDF